ncbi:MAG TPA: hypothetical protein DHW55_02405 [Flavobacteriales bacterium]|nr:hypothetical protein [Flavobacteriales bacterium]
MKLTRSEAWEASFFGFPVEEIRIGNSLFADVTDEVSALIEGAAPETLLKVSVDARQLHAIPWLERQGFELWESRYVWLTTFSRDELTQKHALHASLPEDRIVWGTEAHHEAILSMTQAQVAKSTAVVNRFDSPFYPEGSAEMWYAKWIAQVLQNPMALVAVAEHGEKREVAGYFIYLPGEPRDGVAAYKGILSVIQPAHRGRNLHVHLQQFLFEEMAKRHERVTLDNTTQVSNYPVVRNHAKSGRRPDHIEFVMFRGPHRR